MGSMLKRWGLFILTNILVMVTISLLLNLLGVKPYLSQNGLDYGSLMVFCLVWGMAGSFISLLLSRKMAKWTMGVQIIDPKSPGEYRWLVDSIHGLARRAQLPAMPEVGVYPSAEVNAFATGPSKKRSLVAVSQGLLHSMSRDEIEGVLGHEVAHIQNGDMVTMVLIQGIVNAFTMFLARILAFAITQNVEEDRRPLVHMLVVMVLDIVIGLFGLLVVCWFSRQREFRADSGSARLLGTKQKMTAALEKLARLHGMGDPSPAPAMAALKISGGDRRWLAMFSTHPPIEVRIKALARSA
jgi:heat shock protein HtpX